ncbi:MAG: class I SAM-dependent methyltransferase [Porticoccaceae bacterium]|nr:class I SAM-dependent methyltransferase [Pseudomonadales bacterium]MCP5171848.1 class I SAM-dependent methyltransferase [Pseudomonadales bacterium]
MLEVSDPIVAVVFRPGFNSRAELLSAQLNLPLRTIDELPALEAGIALCVDEQGLCLLPFGSGASGPVRCDFVAGSAQHRRLYGGGKKQDISKATGLNKSGFKPSILDLTAGLGQDAFVLASLGARVTMVERNLLVHALLADGLERARTAAGDEQLQSILNRMVLYNANGVEYLQQIRPESMPDVVYLDPMFPPREKSAKVKKEMQVFHQLVGENNDADQLLAEALVKARYRVVVKRPAHAPILGNREPGYSLKGKSTRFDIYPIKKLPV